MHDRSSVFRILLVDDDPDDRRLAELAVAEAGLGVEVQSVASGVEALDYLRRDGTYTTPGAAPRPHLILLDLWMPEKDGFEILKEIKSDAGLRRIPVIVMTGNGSGPNIQRCYELGAGGYVTKRSSLDAWVDVMSTIDDYWFRTMVLPAA